MPNEREIREQVITQLVNVYTNTPDLGDEAEPLPVFDLEQPGWTDAELAQAYAEAMAMFIYYAREVESQGGPGFLEHLQRQALINADDDGDPSAPS